MRETGQLAGYSRSSISMWARTADAKAARVKIEVVKRIVAVAVAMIVGVTVAVAVESNKGGVENVEKMKSWIVRLAQFETRSFVVARGLWRPEKRPKKKQSSLRRMYVWKGRVLMNVKGS